MPSLLLLPQISGGSRSPSAVVVKQVVPRDGRGHRSLNVPPTSTGGVRHSDGEMVMSVARANGPRTVGELCSATIAGNLTGLPCPVMEKRNLLLAGFGSPQTAGLDRCALSSRCTGVENARVSVTKPVVFHWPLFSLHFLSALTCPDDKRRQHSDASEGKFAQLELSLSACLADSAVYRHMTT